MIAKKGADFQFMPNEKSSNPGTKYFWQFYVNKFC